ncbi:Chromate transport protein [Pseudooceanicola marinus]|uniref:Chromate transport protein n=1 Tax=Pseudooceanicola marinus TaxID=396013 RepID=A0A1X6YKI7_9RHOB|nr:chromate efflux transporter [Pseudooceanicola marinus]PJE29277.1 chromate transporter [Pseudooceanicola marinus]SLN23723.1 Chromate transport protein [Pseudooceanicola marinus]
MPSDPRAPAWRELFQAFGRIGVMSFGGPAAQISVMHGELVDRRRWLSEDSFLGALSFCMLLPGPEAMQLATYSGWRLRGVAGGLMAGLLFVLPGAAVVAALALAYVQWGTLPGVQAAFMGIKALVVALVLQALWRLSQRALPGWAQRAWAVAGFVAIFALGVPFPLLILVAALWGLWRGGAARAQATPVPPTSGTAPSWRRSLVTATLWAVAWLAPVLLLRLSGATFLADLGAFFARLAVLSFGGAYALLAWMAQVTVDQHGWLTPGQMIDALGLAETTPGPLILVTQFVAMVAGAVRAGPELGLAAGALTLWVTFVPCFLFIFVLAPHVERLLALPRLKAALAAVTAAVVGVIASLALWFTLHVLFDTIRGAGAPPLPVWESFQPLAAALVALALALVFILRTGLLTNLVAMAALGLAAVQLGL